MIIWSAYLAVVLLLICLDYCRCFHLHRFSKFKTTLFNNAGSSSEQQISTVPYSGVGCVLLARSGERDRFCSNAAILIHAEVKNKTHGLILDKPGAFYFGDTTPSAGPFRSNWIFVGGNAGPDLGSMLHPYNLPQSVKVAEGVYNGGVGPANAMIESYKANPKEFKFFFRHMEWKPGVLEKEIAAGRWDVCRLPSSLILSQSRETGHIWLAARRALFNEDMSKEVKHFNSESDHEIVLDV